MTEKRVLADAFRYHDIAASELEGDGGNAAPAARARALRPDERRALEGEGAQPRSAFGPTTAATGRMAATCTGRRRGRGRRGRRGGCGDRVGERRRDPHRPGSRRRGAPAYAQSALRVFAASDNSYLVAFVTGFAGRAALRDGRCRMPRPRPFRTRPPRFAALGEDDAVIDARVRAHRGRARAAAGRRARAHARRTARSAMTARAPPAAGSSASPRSSTAADGDAGRAAELAREAAELAGATPFERALSLAHLAAITDPPPPGRRPSRSSPSSGSPTSPACSPSSLTSAPSEVPSP